MPLKQPHGKKQVPAKALSPTAAPSVKDITSLTIKDMADARKSLAEGYARYRADLEQQLLAIRFEHANFPERSVNMRELIFGKEDKDECRDERV